MICRGLCVFSQTFKRRLLIRLERYDQDFYRRGGFLEPELLARLRIRCRAFLPMSNSITLGHALAPLSQASDGALAPGGEAWRCADGPNASEGDRPFGRGQYIDNLPRRVVQSRRNLARARCAT
jgi:hypothetical protein